MTTALHQQASPRSVRLDTLVRLRWLAIIGQLCAVLFVDFGLDFELPLWGCLAVIGLYAAFTVAIRMELDGPQRLDAARAGWLLAIDIAEIAMLLALTGGLQNPFAFLLVGPVLISATALPSHMALLLAGFSTACATVLLFVHLPLPWSSEDPLTLPPVYMLGVWISILLAIGYISVYAWQVTEQARQLADALSATELVLAREQHLSQLDGLAAAAAHELGTPLSTIAVVAKELQLALANSAHSEDARILRDQAQRCRDILAKLTELPAPGEPFEHMALSALMEEVVAPHRDFGVAITVHWPQLPFEPTGARNPAILYGLGNLLENAVDFAKSKVDDRGNEGMFLERLEALFGGFRGRHRETMHFEKLDERPTHRQIVLDDEHEPRFFIHGYRNVSDLVYTRKAANHAAREALSHRRTGRHHFVGPGRSCVRAPRQPGQPT